MKKSRTVQLHAAYDSMRGMASPRWRVSRPLLTQVEPTLIYTIDGVADVIEDHLNTRFR